MASEFVASACPHDCPSTCALEVERLDENTIGKVRGAKDNPYTDGVICAKVGRYAERVHHPDRLTTPLKRTGPKGSGAFEAISWDEALDATADAFKDAAINHGPESVWPYQYAGTMGLLQRFGIERLRHAMSYSGQIQTICSSIGKAGWQAGFGAGARPSGCGAGAGVNALEMAESDLIVMWGVNPVATQINAMQIALRARGERGAGLIVIDPYRTRTAALADLHLPLKPGTDAALACGVMHVLFNEGFADRKYLARHTSHYREFETHLETRTPEWAAAITGLDAADIVAFARFYGQTKRSFLRLGYGFTRQRNGAVNMHAATCLPAVTGAWQHRGGGALFNNGGLYPIDRTLIEGLDVAKPGIRKLDMCEIGPILTGEEAALADGPPVKAMLVQNTNPAVVAPESNKVHAGLARDDLFLCVHEQFMSETARFADIVLPATTFLEHHDIYLGGGHTYLQVTKPVIEPQGEARSNHEVICELANRLGAEHPGFSMSGWEMVDRTLRDSGLPDAETVHATRWFDCAMDFEDAHFLNGFGTPDGLFHFKPDWKAMGPTGAELPPMPDHHPTIEDTDTEHPLRLVTAPSRNFLNSSFTETPSSTKAEGRPTAFIHSEVCAELGVVTGDPIRLGNARGSVVVHVKAFDGLHKDVVIVETIWPNAAYVEGLGINALTGSDPVPPLGGAAFHDTAVWVKAAQET